MCCAIGLNLTADQQSNILIYGEGSTQISSEINQYDSIVANTPIPGSVMVTHDVNADVDINSFRLGNTPLKVTFVQTTPISSYSTLVVSIYQFQLDGMKPGIHTMPPISVRVGNKEYQAASLIIKVAR